MRRPIDFEPKPFFRGGELPRLMTLVVMLGVISMLIARAQDPRTWTMFAQLDTPAQETEEPESKPSSAPEVPPPPDDRPAVAEDEQESSPGTKAANTQPQPSSPAEDLPPLGEEPEEREALDEELQAVVDKVAFQKEEMAAYWRLVRWAKDSSFDALQPKALRKVRFANLFEHPEKYRGKLIEVKIHLRQVLEFKGDEIEADNPADVTKIYEIRGWNSDSQPYWYWCVTPQLPPGLPLGEKVLEEGTFVGYFFKLVSYEDREGKVRATPVLVGWLKQDPPVLQRSDPQQQIREWTWVMLAGAAIGVTLLIRWGLRQMSGPKGRSSSTSSAIEQVRRRRPIRPNEEEPDVDVETWLDRKESSEDETAINPPEEGESEGEDDRPPY